MRSRALSDGDLFDETGANLVSTGAKFANRVGRDNLDEFLAESCLAALYLGFKLAAFEEQSVEDFRLGHVCNALSLDIDNAAAVTGKHRYIGTLRLAGTIHNATHDRDLDRQFEFGHQLLFDLLHKGEKVDLDAATGWASDQLNALAFSLAETVEEFEAVLDLINVVARVRDAQRVADTVGDKRAERGNRTNRAGVARPSVGDSEVQRIVKTLRNLGINVNDHRRVHGFCAYGNVMKVARIEDVEVLLEFRDHQREHVAGLVPGEKLSEFFCAPLLVLSFNDGTFIDADPDRDPSLLAGIDDHVDLVAIADVSGVESNLMYASFDRFERALEVEMHICNDRNRDLLHDLDERFRVLAFRDRHADDVGTSGCVAFNFTHAGVDVMGVASGHGLHCDAGIAANTDAADAIVAHGDLTSHSTGIHGSRVYGEAADQAVLRRRAADWVSIRRRIGLMRPEARGDIAAILPYFSRGATMSPTTAVASPAYVRSRLSLMMFLQYAIWGAWLPILYPFLMGHRGFSLDQTGLCLMAGAVGALAGPFIAGQLADRSFATERLLAFSHLVGAVLVYFLASAAQFEVFLALSFVYGLVYAPTLALTNSISFANLADRDRDFGPVRLWGTLGWIAAGIAVGQILLRFHTPTGESTEAVAAAQNAGRAVAFQISAGLGLVMAFYCMTLPHTPPTRSSVEKTAWLEGVKEIFKQPLITLFLIAVPISMVHQFYFIFTSDFVGAIQNSANSEGANSFARSVNQVLGVGGGGLMTIGQMTELLVLAAIPFFSKTVSRKTLLLTGIAAYAARMALFAFLPTLPFVLLGVALHGLCFGCFIFVAFMVVDENTTPDIRATAQNLFNLVIVGIGIIVGSIFATSVVAKYATDGGASPMDYTKLFSVPMYMALACFVLMLLFYPSKKRQA